MSGNKRKSFKKMALSAFTIWINLAIVALFCISFNCNLRGVDGAAVMSVDLGSEWMKVGVVSPGVPMEIALNRESKRKTPVILAFRDGMRTFGEDAVTVGIREPSQAYGYLLDLLGKTVDNPIVDLYRKRFPYYDIVPDPERRTVIFKKSETEQFSVEELIAQILVKAKEFAQESTAQQVTECVLTVPGYFGQAEREALLASAQLANLKVLQLINDYTAVALNYGVFHRAEINETTQYFLFYDMGAYKTSAAVVSYQLVKDKQTRETNPVIQVLGVGYDRTLGGLEIQLRLRDYLAAEFNAMKKTKSDVTKSPRSLAKLFKEAGRLKNVLSANNEHYAQIENLLDDQDFKLLVTREKLEELCVDLWPRITKPLEQALAASGLSMDVITQVILFGGGTRVPKVQDIIKDSIKQELGKSLNADEAATMGAVYKAADLATGFKVKKFIVKDAVLYPIQVSFERDPGDGSGVRQVKRLLFGHMNAYPQKKVITFNKHTEDFDFYVHYGELNYLPQQEIAFFGGQNISRVHLSKIKELLEKHQKDVMESKGIKAYFLLDDSGIFRCTGVEYVYEKQKIEEPDEGTLAKLGSTISKLFSKDAGKQQEGTEKSDNAEPTKDEEGQDVPTGDAEKSNEEKDSTQKAPEEVAGDIKPNEDVNKTETKLDENAKPENKTIKIVTVKEPVEHKLNFEFTMPLLGEAFDKSLDKLNEINNAEENRNRLESSFNALESHVVETQQKLGEEEYASCTTPEEKQKILDECAAISNWLYEDIENPTPDVYEKRLNELKKLTNVFMARHWEHEERAEALKALDGMIDGSQKFLASAKNLTKDTNPEKDVFTNVEVETLAKVIDETVEWKKKEVAAQKKLKRNEEVRLTVKDLTEKMSLLDREVKYLVNKIKIWKPKVKPTKKPKKEAKENATEEAAESAEINMDEVQVDEPQLEGEQATNDEVSNENQKTEEGNEEDASPKPSATAQQAPTPHSEL